MAETADVAQHARQVDDERRERRVDILTLVILLAFATSFTFLYVHVLYLGHPVPLFAFPPYDTGYFGGEFPTSPKILGVHTFSDFYEMWARARDPNPYLPNDGDLLPASPYLPFAHVIALPLKLLPLGVATPVYLGLLVFGLLTLTWYTVRFLPQLTRARTAVVLVLFCGPVLMLVDRGNIEGVLILLIWGAILLAAADRWVWAAILLAAAIAMKGHPGLFLVLFLLERKFWQAALCVVLAAAMTYLPLLLMPGSIGDSYDAMRIVQNNIDLALSSNLNYNSSAKALLIRADALQGGGSVFGDLAQSYMTVAVVVGLALWGLILWLRPRLWQTVAVIAAATLLLAPFSNEYRGPIMLIPVTLFLADAARIRLGWPILACFAWLIALKGLPRIRMNDATYYNRFVLVVLIALCLVSAFLDWRARRRPAQEAADDLADAVPA